MLARPLCGVIFAMIAMPVAGQGMTQRATCVAAVPSRWSDTYSLQPGAATRPHIYQSHHRVDGDAPPINFELDLTERHDDVRDRFEARALPLSRARGEAPMSAGLQFKLVGDAGGFESSVRVAGVVPRMMRYALR